MSRRRREATPTRSATRFEIRGWTSRTPAGEAVPQPAPNQGASLKASSGGGESLPLSSGM